MIKTTRFVSVFLLLICSLIINQVVLYAETNLGEITLTDTNKQRLLIEDGPQVFLPSKLIIGQENSFRIKGPPGSKVSLAISSTNKGAKPLFGQQLRIGPAEKTIEGEIPATGILELKYEIPDDTNLINSIRFVEAAVWKANDYSDIQIATTISSSGRETLHNGITITHPPSDGKKPMFGPVIPGVGQEIIRTIENIQRAKDGSINPDLLEDGSPPAYLDSPETREVYLQNIQTEKR
jgi:hypothetical protein